MKRKVFELANGDSMYIEIWEKNLLEIEKLDTEQLYVSPGWIDLHTHCYSPNQYVGDEIDKIGVTQGVSIVVDAGSIGVEQLEEFKEYRKTANTSSYIFMNISNIGLSVENELSNINDIDILRFMDVYKHNKDLIKGIKVRLSKKVMDKKRIEPIVIAKYLSEEVGLPIMVHVGNPGLEINNIIKFLGKGDIITHCFHGKELNILNSSPTIIENIIEKQNEGMLLDLGHGSASFSSSITLKALEHGIKADTISSDIYRRNRINGKVKSLPNVMTKMMNLGYSLPEIIEGVTTRPAAVLGLSSKLDPNSDQGITLFSIKNVSEIEMDSNNNKIKISKRIVPHAVIKNGKMYLVQED